MADLPDDEPKKDPRVVCSLFDKGGSMYWDALFPAAGNQSEVFRKQFEIPKTVRNSEIEPRETLAPVSISKFPKFS